MNEICIVEKRRKMNEEEEEDQDEITALCSQVCYAIEFRFLHFHKISIQWHRIGKNVLKNYEICFPNECNFNFGLDVLARRVY